MKITLRSLFSALASLALAAASFAQGTQLWAKRFNGSANGEDYGLCVAADAQGNVYVAGALLGATTNYDYVVVKYTPTGALAWSKTYNGPGNYEDWVLG